MPLSPLLGELRHGTEAGLDDVVAGPPAGDVGGEAVPRGFADRVGWSRSDQLVEPVGLGAGEVGGVGAEVLMDGSVDVVDLAGVRAERADRGGPPGQLRLDAVPEAVEGGLGRR